MSDSGFGRGPIPGRPGSAANQDQQDVKTPGSARSSARLDVANGPALGRSYPLLRDKMLIGRNDPPALMVDIDLSDAELSNTPVVSRRHAELSWVENGLFLRDLGSTNGSMLNGRDITRRVGEAHAPAEKLKNGDRILIANIELVLQLDPAPR
jgi:pSer/pThr/pTyr-binding forkhead associated (FHA) protein